MVCLNRVFDHFVGLALKGLRECVNLKQYIGGHRAAWPYRSGQEKLGARSCRAPIVYLK